MSAPGSPLPSITGNQSIDRLIRSGLLAVAAGATGVIVTWLNAHGFHDPNLSLMISGAIVSTLTGAAIVAWGWINGKNTEAAAKQALVDGVSAGIAHAESPIPTIPLQAVTPEAATAIVAQYKANQ